MSDLTWDDLIGKKVRPKEGVCLPYQHPLFPLGSVWWWDCSLEGIVANCGPGVVRSADRALLCQIEEQTGVNWCGVILGPSVFYAPVNKLEVVKPEEPEDVSTPGR